MFCPNCGTQNDSAATPCKKCGFKLSSVSLPKFRGTMLLNSEQTAQELIDEQRRRQAQPGPGDKTNAVRGSEPAPKRNPGSSAPPGSLSGPRGPVFQPPRAAPRGRMGGTIMGVAPQSGGILPPDGSAPRSPEGGNAVGGLARAAEAGSAPARPEPANERTRSDETADATREATSDVVMSAPNASATDEAASEMAVGAPNASATDPLAGTVAVPVVAETPSAPPAPSASASTAAAPAPAVAARSPGPAKTVPLAAVASAAAAGEATAADAPDDSPALVDLRGADTQPPRNRAVAPTAAIPRGSASTSSSPSRIRPFDVVLIVCTLGLYGIVLLFKLRKRAV